MTSALLRWLLPPHGQLSGAELGPPGQRGNSSGSQQEAAVTRGVPQPLMVVAASRLCHSQQVSTAALELVSALTPSEEPSRPLPNRTFSLSLGYVLSMYI